MEVIKVVGIRPFAFADDAGVNHEGYSLHCLVENEYVHGHEAKKFSVNKTVMDNNIYNKVYYALQESESVELIVYYNSRGKISKIEFDA